MCFFFWRMGFSTHCNVIPPRQCMKLEAMSIHSSHWLTEDPMAAHYIYSEICDITQHNYTNVSLLITKHVWVKFMGISCPVLCFDWEKQSFFWSVLGSWGRCYRDQDRQSNPFSSKLRSQRTIWHSQLRLSKKHILSVITFYWTYRKYEFVLRLFLPFIYRVTIAE